MKHNYLIQAWLILAMTVIFGAVLAGVQVAWGPIIEANKRNEALRQVPELIGEVDIADPATGETIRVRALEQLTEEVTDGETVIAYRAYWQRRYEQTGLPTGPKVQVGWVIKGSGGGYADTIELLIGLDTKAQRITGLYVLKQNETPGLGNKISQPKWRGQFAGKSTARPLRVVKGAPGADEIQAVSGATISSRSVADIVNKAVEDFRAKLPQLNKQE